MFHQLFLVYFPQIQQNAHFVRDEIKIPIMFSFDISMDQSADLSMLLYVLYQLTCCLFCEWQSSHPIGNKDWAGFVSMSTHLADHWVFPWSGWNEFSYNIYINNITIPFVYYNFVFYQGQSVSINLAFDSLTTVSNYSIFTPLIQDSGFCDRSW